MSAAVSDLHADDASYMVQRGAGSRVELAGAEGMEHVPLILGSSLLDFRYPWLDLVEHS